MSKPIAHLLPQLNEWLSYDANTGVFRWKKIGNKWRNVKPGDEAGCSKGGYRVLRFLGGNYHCHRLAWLMYYGEEPPVVIDHKDQDKANNAISNLRDGALGVNDMNRKAMGRFGVTGIGERNGTYRARLRQTDLYIGPDFFEACCARKSAENQYWAAHG